MEPQNILTCTGKGEVKGSMDWCTAPPLCPPPLTLMVCKVLSVYANSTVDLRDAHFVLSFSFPPTEHSQSRGLSHLPEVLNPCFQPEHTARVRGTLNTGQGTSSVHPFPIGWGKEARQVISQRYNPVPPIPIGWGEARGGRGDWTGDIPEVQPSLSTFTSRDSDVL